MATATKRAETGVRNPSATTRGTSEALSARLSAEDMVVQSMEDASPAKWHLGHTTWFFEAFVLAPFERLYRPHDARFAHCFNSYYVRAGSRHSRALRGMLTRPSADEVRGYRAAVDTRVAALLDDAPAPTRAQIEARVELGCHH